MQARKVLNVTTSNEVVVAVEVAVALEKAAGDPHLVNKVGVL